MLIAPCKILLFVIILSFFAGVANGQFTYGVKAGMDYSTTLAQGHVNPYANGFVAGITSDIDVGKSFFISSHFYYSKKILLGVNLGILLNSKIGEGDSAFITTSQLQRIDPGLDAGLRYQFDRWGVDFSFVRSLIGIEKTKRTYYLYNGQGMGFPETYTIPESEKSKNIAFEVSIYYLFGGK